ncbi:hypothetical protein CBR_g71365, partial [Chara braunii]
MMASNVNSALATVSTCHNCQQPGHISRYCPLSDRRLQASTSIAIVSAQTPLLTAPAANVGTAVQPYSGQYPSGGGWLGKRVSTLEEQIAKISIRHDVAEAKERALQEEAEKKKRIREEEERRQRDQQEREKYQAKMNRGMKEKLDKVVEAIKGKKSNENDKVARLKAEVERLKKSHNGASNSATVTQPGRESEELVRLRREQAEMKVAAEKRFASLEDVILALQKQCEEAENNAEVWRNEALHPRNKRGCVAIGQTPRTEARVRPRVTPTVAPNLARQVDPQLKGIVERHAAEVELLKDVRLKEVNAQKESEKEVERLKNEVARSQTKKKKTGGTNLKARLNDVVGPSTKKRKEKVVVSPVKLAVD